MVGGHLGIDTLHIPETRPYPKQDLKFPPSSPMSPNFLWMLSVRMVTCNKGAWYWIGSCDPSLDNKGDGIKRIATIVKSTVSVDFFTVPTIRFQVLYVFLVLAHDRRGENSVYSAFIELVLFGSRWKPLKILEREMGFEPTASSLGT